MLLAVLDRHAELRVLDHDVFVNVAGGLRLYEPAADLAILLAVASSHLRRAVPGDLVALGEIGLPGEIRQAPRLELRLAEAARLGFKRALVAERVDGAKPTIPAGLELLRVKTVSAAIAAALE
ncbi:MAG TPA: DNA repair protein RadA, partial [Nannocystaceae bacterium]|nr:DNA repair protein RadA [Nannocystaceae bacterium]